MNLQSITGIYPSNIGSYTQSITGVYNTGGGGEYINTDNNIVIDNVSNIINLSTNIINSLTDLSNNKQDNITLVAGNNISISNLNSSWTIEALATGGQYSNPDNNLVINNVNGTINLSTDINVSNISADIITAGITRIKTGNTSDALFGNSELTDNTNYYAIRQLSSGKTFINSYGETLTFRKTDITAIDGKSTRTVGDMTWNGTTLAGNKLKFTEVDASTLIIPDNALSKDKITGLNTSLGNLSNSIDSLNTNVSNLSNNKQDNITLVAGNNISISNLNSSWTIEALATGGQYSNPDNNLVINNVNGTINLSSSINVSNINTSSLTIPNNTITKNKITNLNASLNSLSNSIDSLNTNVSNLSNNKQDNITLVAGNNISITKINSSWTIEALATGGQYSNSDNNLVINNVSDTINLSTTINVSNISADEITSNWTKIGLLTGTLSQTANFAHRNFFTNTGYALLQTNGGQTRINSNTDNIQVVKTLRCLEGINCEKILNASNINASTINTTTLIIPDNAITKDKITGLNTSLGSLSNSIGSLNTSVSNLSNNKQNNITLIAGANISISKLNSSWTISAIATEYSNPDNNLVINNVNDTINLSTTINVSNLNTSTLTIPINSITKDKITNLNASLNSLSNKIGSLNTSVSGLSGAITTLNTSVSNLSNNKQNNITLIAGANISISKLNSSWTISAIASGAEYSNTDNNLVINNVSDTINLSTTINVSNLNTSTLTLPNNALSKSKITDLVANLSSINSSITNLNSNKEDNISIVAGNNISILFDNNNNKWTINSTISNLSVASSSDNLSILNGSINLSESIYTYNGTFDNLYVNTSIDMPINSITKDKITGLNTSLGSLSNSIGSLNTSVSNLSNNKQNNITLSNRGSI